MEPEFDKCVTGWPKDITLTSSCEIRFSKIIYIYETGI